MEFSIPIGAMLMAVVRFARHPIAWLRGKPTVEWQTADDGWLHLVVTARGQEYEAEVSEVRGASPAQTTPWFLPWRLDAATPRERSFRVSSAAHLNLAQAVKNDPTPPGFWRLFSTSKPEGWWPVKHDGSGAIDVTAVVRSCETRRSAKVTLRLRLDRDANPLVEQLR